MARVQVGPVVFEEDGPPLQAALARLHDTRERPLCLCVESGVALRAAETGHNVVTAPWLRAMLIKRPLLALVGQQAFTIRVQVAGGLNLTAF